MLFKIFTRIILYLLFLKFLNLIERRYELSYQKIKKKIWKGNLENTNIYIYWKLVKTESLLTKYYVSRDKIIISVEIRKITNKISRKTFQNLYLESKRNITCFEREGKRERVGYLVDFVYTMLKRAVDMSARQALAIFQYVETHKYHSRSRHCTTAMILLLT